jgi:hypothetical protein
MNGKRISSLKAVTVSRIAVAFASVLLLCAAAPAVNKPDTFALMKAAKKLVEITKIENITTGAAIYQIEFCPDQKCDMFEAEGTKLTTLSDYAYLFAVYKGDYQEYGYTDAGREQITDYEVVRDAKANGFAQATLDAYSGRFNCTTAKNKADCVMHGLFKAAAIKRYFLNYDEGVSYRLTDENGDYLRNSDP